MTESSVSNPLPSNFESPQKSSHFQRIRSFLCQCNAEPVIFLSTFSFGLISPIIALFFYYARCVHLFSPTFGYENITAVCQDLSAFNDTLEEELSVDIATWNIYLQLASGIPLQIVTPLLGAWADRKSGRRLPLLFGLFGCVFYGIVLVLATIMHKTMDIAPLLLVASLILGSTGGVSAVFVTTFAMITDQCRPEMTMDPSNVPKRIALASSLSIFGLTAGSMVAWALTEMPEVGDSSTVYLVGVSTGAVLLVATAGYGSLVVKETLPLSTIGQVPEPAGDTRQCSNLGLVVDDGDDDGDEECNGTTTVVRQAQGGHHLRKFAPFPTGPFWTFSKCFG